MSANDRENLWLSPNRIPAAPGGGPCPPITIRTPAEDAHLPMGPVEVCGDGQPGFQMVVVLDGHERYQTEADAAGRYRLRIDPAPPAGVHSLSVYQTGGQGQRPTTVALQFTVEEALQGTPQDAPDARANAETQWELAPEAGDAPGAWPVCDVLDVEPGGSAPEADGDAQPAFADPPAEERSALAPSDFSLDEPSAACSDPPSGEPNPAPLDLCAVLAPPVPSVFTNQRTQNAARYGPQLTLRSAAMGAHFRSIALTLSASFAGCHLMVHAVFVPAGSPPLTATQVVGYMDQDALTRQCVARALFPVFADERSAPLVRTLHGREGVTPYPGETGLIDGVRYDVYAVGEAADGTRTALCALTSAVPAMPFSGGDGRLESPYLLRQLTEAEMREAPDLRRGHPLNGSGINECARMLDNIEGMRALHAHTQGKHGLAGTLGCCYRLTTSFDLSAYAEAYGGRGWRPIGGTEPGFSGVLEGIHPTVAIMNLSQRWGSEDCPTVLGLIGLLRGGVLRTLWLDHPRIAATTAPGRQSYIGGLVGMGSGTLENIRVTQGWYSAGCADARGCAWVGTVMGAGLDGTAIRGAHVLDSVLETDGMGYAALGGIAGLISVADGKPSALEDSEVERVNFLGAQPMGGAIAFAQAKAGALTISNVRVRAELYGDAHLGGLVGKAEGAHKLLHLTRCKIAGSLVGSVDVGGLIGAGSGLRCDDCTSTASVSAVRNGGGLCGTLRSAELLRCHHEGTTSATQTYAAGLIAIAHDVCLRFCEAQGRVSAVYGEAAGLIAQLTGTRKSRCTLEDCTYEGPTVQGGTTGGVVGRALGEVRLQRCLTRGIIFGYDAAGGIVGACDGVGQVLACALLARWVGTTADHPVALIAALPGHLRLSGNQSIATAEKLRAKIPQHLDNGLDRPDGALIAPEDLAGALKRAGYPLDILERKR